MRSSTRSFALVALVVAVMAFFCGAVVTAALASAPRASAPPADPGLGVQASPSSVRYGESVRLQVHIGVPGATVQLSRAYTGDPSPTPLRTLVTDAAGDAAWTDTPAASATYRAEYAGDAAWAAAVADAAVTVRAKVQLSTDAGARVRTGDAVTVKVGVVPGAAAAPVAIQEWDAGAGSWDTLATVTPDGSAQARWVWRPRSLGRHRLRAVLSASAASPLSVSGVRSVRVFDRTDKYGVPATYPHLILVDLSEYRLHYYEHGRVVRTFDCVLGRPSLPTPRGHFKIYAKDPSMSGAYGPRRMRYRGLYAIHGTNEPWLLSRWPRNYSHGCTRLSNTNIVWLFDRVHVGTPVWNVP